MTKNNTRRLKPNPRVQGMELYTCLKSMHAFKAILLRMEAWMSQLLHALALPEFGLSTICVVAFISATLLPLGSEPAVYGLVLLNPQLFWPAILVATLGNALGGVVTWWMGYGTHTAIEKAKPGFGTMHALAWLEKLGPKACFFSFLPVVGDPLCFVAGWLKLPLRPCSIWMTIGKFLRYLIMTALLLWVVPNSWVAFLLQNS